MQQGRFKKYIRQVHDLTPSQRQRLSAVLNRKTAVERMADTVNRHRAGNAHCPHCASERLRKWGQTRGLQRFRCKECKRTFTVLTGTPLAGLWHLGEWAAFAQAMKDGLSVRGAADKCGAHFTTMFRWRHRWLRMPRDRKGTAFHGIVEADETFFLESRKGSRVWVKAKRGEGPIQDRKPRKRGGVASKRGLSAEQIPVLTVLDRHGTTTDAVLPALNKETVKAVLKPIMSKDTLLCTDGLTIYKTLSREEGFAHQSLNVGAGNRVKARVFHIQNVNAYHSRLKGWMRRFRGVATSYLPNYLGWRRMLENYGKLLNPIAMLTLALG
jgi:transposase-like protein